MDLTENGAARSGVKVTFTYNGSTKEATTDNSGRAQVGFSASGDQSVKAEPQDGYPTQFVFVNDPDNCPPTGGSSNNGNGQVLGASTESSSGQVLGATTAKRGQVLGAYAATGVFEDTVMSVAGSLGGVFTTAGSVLWARKKRE